jgi:2-(1,2-epoxy-1,2-dihydrophenyl)acetyl-CoA isomerase
VEAPNGTAVAAQIPDTARSLETTVSDHQTIEVDQRGAVLWLTLARPDARNGITLQMQEELVATFAAADADRSVRAILVTGSGSAFCTGADLTPSGDRPVGLLGSSEMSLLDYGKATDPWRALFKTYWELETPVVAAVNGTVAGAGWMLALLADLVVAAEDARWVHVFAERGMVPHAGDPYFLPRVLPFHALNELAMLRERFTSADLHRWGAVNRLVPGDDVVATAAELAERLASGPTLQLGQTKRLYRRSLDLPMEAVFGLEAAATVALSQTHDRKEGVQSLLERRPADFRGE